MGRPFTWSRRPTKTRRVPEDSALRAGAQEVFLIEEPMAAGDHSFTWDGRSSRGAPLASGVYFVRLRIGDSIFPHKIVLMR